jgi:hypothetical protein
MAINKIQLEQDGLVVGNNQLTASGGGVYIGKSLSVANVIAVGNTTINTTAISANVISVGNTSVRAFVNSSIISVSDSVGNTTFINSVAVSVSGNSITPYQGMRNRLINGGMDIWQRGTSFSLPSGGVSSANNYTADRWICYSGGSSPGHTVTRTTDVPSSDFLYSLKNQRNSGNTSTGSIYSVQFVESVNCYDLSNSLCTLSFWAECGSTYSGANNALNVVVGTGTTADQGYSTLAGAGWAGYATPLNVNATLATNWRKYTYTFMVGSGTREMFVMFNNPTSGTAGADDSYSIAGVQLEKGPVATPFEKRLYTTELALCQRYYQTIPTGGIFVSSYGGGGVTSAHTLSFPITMRTAPTITSPSFSYTGFGTSAALYTLTAQTGYVSWGQSSAGNGSATSTSPALLSAEL